MRNETTKRTTPISEKEVSENIGRAIKSPIRILSLSDININQTAFVDYFTNLFAELSWDYYDLRRLQIEYLKAVFPDQQEEIHQYFKAYFTGATTINVLEKWIAQLSPTQKVEFEAIQPWRRRSVAKFEIKEKGNRFELKRVPVTQFEQSVEESDFRSWPRIFEEAPKSHVEHQLFYQFIFKIFMLVRSVQPEVKAATFTAHFMSVQATATTPGDNSPEGAHEDGAAYIVSALVINRKNVSGAESQVLEKLSDNRKELILRHTLQPGEFAFQADTGEELIFGNDLWHHVTPFHLTDPSAGEGWRDIIGFDIEI